VVNDYFDDLFIGSGSIMQHIITKVQPSISQHDNDFLMVSFTMEELWQ